MEKILSGNMNRQLPTSPAKDGWFLGHFVTGNDSFRSDQFEVKWGRHPKGDIKVPPALNKTAKTLSILIEGSCKIFFPNDEKEFVLAQQGDYVFFENQIVHGFEALEDCLTLTIRWPSLPNDQDPPSGHAMKE